MSLWEYKVITSGKGGFATPALLEKFLNDLGRDEWEIVEFHPLPDNFLAFTGLARRSTQRDWTLQDAAAAAAKAEAEKLRVEFEAKFKAATASGGGAGGEPAPSFLEEKLAPDDGFRKLVDTSHDGDPDAEEDEHDDWDKLTAAEEDELPTFFDAIKPHLRRNQRGPGQSVGVDYLAKKWDQTEEDLRGALVECGFELPADEDAKPVYVDYDGDLYWLNINRRGELWINTKEKPRPTFKMAKATRVPDEAAGEGLPAAGEARGGPARRSESDQNPDIQKPDTGDRKPERPARPARDETAPANQSAIRDPQSAMAAPLPAGPALLNKIRPHMRRNRRGPGGSGSTSFLSRALKCNEADLTAAFVGLGLAVPASPQDQPVCIEIADELWWLNHDSRGGLWINGREKQPGETVASAVAVSDSAPPPETVPGAAAREGGSAAPGSALRAASGGLLAEVRLRLKEGKTGSFSAKVERLADELGKAPADFVATLVEAGLKVPEKAREKPVFVEQAGEIFWLNKNAKDELWLNAKTSKFVERKAGAGEAGADEDGGKKPRRGRSRKKAE